MAPSSAPPSRCPTVGSAPADGCTPPVTDPPLRPSPGATARTRTSNFSPTSGTVSYREWWAGTRTRQDGDREPDLGFTITEKFLPERAKASWIRTAYLAAFAALGWLYVLQRELQPIRDQLKHPDEKILPALTSYDVKAPSSRRQIHLIHEPTDIRCVLVSMGQHGVFLPGLGNPLSCVELSEAISRRVGGSQSMLNIRFDHAQEVPWPSLAHIHLGP